MKKHVLLVVLILGFFSISNANEKSRKNITVSEENSKGSWHGWDISLVGQVQDIGLYGAAKAFAESISTGDVEVMHQQDGSGIKDNAPF